MLPKREFFMLFDELFSSQTKLSASLHTRLLHVYPRLKVSLQLCSCICSRERERDGDGDDDCAADADDCMLCVCVVKAITFGRHPESILHNYFTSFLSRLTHGCHGSKKTEVES